MPVQNPKFVVKLIEKFWNLCIVKCVWGAKIGCVCFLSKSLLLSTSILDNETIDLKLANHMKMGANIIILIICYICSKSNE